MSEMFRAGGPLPLLAMAFAVACSNGPTPAVDAGGDGAADVARDASDAATADMGEQPQSGCNPLGEPYDCLLPFPSDVFLANGTVQIPDEAAPRDPDGAPFQLQLPITADGFSVHPSILFTFGEGLDPASLVPQAESAVSVTAASPTLLIDTAANTLVPHFSEVYLGGDEDEQIGAIRPLVRLDESTRYVVAIKGARTTAGADVTPPAGFVAKADPDVLAIVEGFGVDRADLDLAWDFTTRSRDNVMGNMLAVRDGTMEWLATNTPTVTIVDTFEGADLGVPLTGTFRHVEGTFTAPLWTETDEPAAMLAGEIVGTIEVPFTLTIPRSVEADPALRPARFVQYAHGFFGRREEVISQVQSEFGNELGLVMGAVDFSGMTRDDRAWVVNAFVDDPPTALNFAPRVHQGIANNLVFTEVVKTLLPAEPAVQLDGVAAYDPDQVYFIGISQGHILGGTFMGVTQAIDRAVLNVGGASFGLILTRSFAFVVFELLLEQSLKGIDLLKYEALIPLALEPIDPITYAPLVTARMLLQGGMGDTAVPNVSMELHARALGIPLVTPSPHQIPFIAEAPAPAPAGVTFFDFGLAEDRARDWDRVNTDTEPHEGVRRFPGARQQIDLFLRPGGMIEDTCNGPCVVQ